jgi:hypothetical protein
MKRFIAVVLFIGVVVAGIVYTAHSNSELRLGDNSDFVITESSDIQGIVIETKLATFRISDKGEIEKRVWDTINFNEEATTGRSIGSSWSYLTTASTAPLSAWQPNKKEKDDGYTTISKIGTFVIKYNPADKMIEVTNSKIELRIYKCGEVKKHKWQTI